MINNIIEKTRKLVISLTPDNSGIRSAFKRIYKSLPRDMRDSYLLEAALAAFQGTQGIKFVQIGANDGVHADGLYPYVKTHQWYGLMVEPNPAMLTKLRANHAQSASDIAYEDVAIGASGRVVLYWSEAWPGAASTSRQHVEAHLPEPGAEILCHEVTMMTFAALIERHPEFGSSDILFIDTEGWDGKIILSIDFSVFRCDLLIYEYIHLESQEQADVIAHLRASGYASFVCGNDMVVINTQTQYEPLRTVLDSAERL